MGLNIAAAIVIGYLLGSIPFAYIVAHLKKGVDIRQVGGGNVGALNTYRQIGPLWGIGVLAADIIKGALAVLIARWLGLSIAWVCVAGFAAVVGHNWPVFLKFRGGKGAATVLGVLVALTPVELLISAGIVLILIAVTRNVRLALLALVFVLLFDWLFDKDFIYIACALGLLLFIGIRTLIDLRRELAREDVKKNLFIDKEYTPWQTRKNLSKQP
jgi:glycerol-3-phosphate acyltransferase PlsY